MKPVCQGHMLTYSAHLNLWTWATYKRVHLDWFCIRWNLSNPTLNGGIYEVRLQGCQIREALMSNFANFRLLHFPFLLRV